MKRVVLSVAVVALATVTLLAQASKVISSGTLPSSCSNGAVYVKTGSAKGWYVCDSGSWVGPYLSSSGLPTPTDDTVPVGNGASHDAKTVPNCTDSGGNHLNYTQSTNAFSCGTSSSGGGGGSGTITAAFKTSDESVTSSTTLQDDDELALSVAASSTYVAQFSLLTLSASTAPDIKFQFTGPSGTTVLCSVVGHPPTSGGGDNQSRIAGGDLSAGPLPMGVLTTASLDLTPIMGTCTVTTGGSSGTLQLQWAQNSSNGSATTMKAGSLLMLTKP